VQAEVCSEPIVAAGMLAQAERSSVAQHVVVLGDTHVAQVEAGDVVVVVTLALRAEDGARALQHVDMGASMPQTEAAGASRSSEVELAVAPRDIEVPGLGPTGALLVAESVAKGEMAAR